MNQVVVLCPSVVSLFCNILSQQQCFEFDWLKNLEKKNKAGQEEQDEKIIKCDKGKKHTIKR